MNRKTFKQEYFEWLCHFVKLKNHKKLLFLLFSIDFTYDLPMDGNRYEDGIDLRYRFADEKGYPVTFTLENLRYNDPSNVEMLCSSVALTVSNVDSERLGVCFDMGHRLSSLNKFGEDSDPADDSFYSLVRHTHIHSLYKGVTHLPLTVGKSALDENLSALARNGYRGVLNLEVNLGRFDEPFDAKESFEGSVRILKEAASRAFGDN